jgi:predicted MFS family arabinose efflux permease
MEQRSAVASAWVWDAYRTLQLTALMLARLVINTSLRMVYPFAPALARGLGVPLVTIYVFVALRNFTGLLAPLFNPFYERFGRRTMMLMGMVVFALAMLLVARIPAVWALGIALVISGLSKVVFDPAMHSYLGDAVPYHQRGRAIAITEFSWSTSFLVGMPIVGWLIQREGWQAPFLWLAVGALFIAVLIWRILPPVQHGQRRIVGLSDTWRVLCQYPVIWAAVLFMGLESGASELFLIVYGDWMEESFGLTLTNLGLTATVIGLAELCGEALAGFAVDRFGKRPVVITAGLLGSLAYLLIPLASVTLATAIVTMAVTFLLFELTIVGSVPLLTQLVPSARTVVMSMILAAVSIGRAFGSLLGPLLWEQGGLGLNALTAAVLSIASIFVLARWLREGEEVDSGQSAVVSSRK